MKSRKQRLSIVLTLIAALVLLVSGVASALAPAADGYFHTGTAMRTKSIAFISVKVYSIRHDMKQLPPQKSKRAIIDMATDKKFTWTMMRDVPSEKIKNAMREAFQMNGYRDGGKIERFVGAFNQGEVKEHSAVQIRYEADKKTTTIWVQNGASVTIEGEEFMRAVWSIWFGNIDPPSIGDDLMRNL